MTPYTLRIEFLDGRPDGLAVANLIYRPIRVLHVPRSGLDDLEEYPEASGTGVYLLTGPDPADPVRPKVYIGEADDVLDRLRRHDRENVKTFWRRTFCVVSGDDELNKGHARFLESELCARASAANRASLVNGNRPAPKRLSRAHKAFMSEFLDDLGRILPAFGLDILNPTAAPCPVPAESAPPVVPPPRRVEFAPNTEPPAGPRFEMSVRGNIAHATDRDGAFIVLRGSWVSRDVGSLRKGSRKRRELLVKNGVIGPDAASTGEWAFLRDESFSGVSTAATVVAGGERNGRVTWKRPETGQTYGDWEAAGRPN